MTSASTGQSDADTALSRRKVFAMCSLGLLGATGLAACGSDEPGTATATTGPATAPSASATTGTEVVGGDVVSLIALADVPVAGAVGLEDAGDPVIVSQPVEGEAVAFSAVCPHQFATVVVSGKQLRCPLHGSMFDLATGRNLTGPAAGKPLPSVPVKVVDGEVVRA